MYQLCFITEMNSGQRKEKKKKQEIIEKIPNGWQNQRETGHKVRTKDISEGEGAEVSSKETTRMAQPEYPATGANESSRCPYITCFRFKCREVRTCYWLSLGCLPVPLCSCRHFSVGISLQSAGEERVSLTGLPQMWVGMRNSSHFNTVIVRAFSKKVNVFKEENGFWIHQEVTNVCYNWCSNNLLGGYVLTYKMLNNLAEATNALPEHGEVHRQNHSRCAPTADGISPLALTSAWCPEFPSGFCVCSLNLKILIWRIIFDQMGKLTAFQTYFPLFLFMSIILQTNRTLFALLHLHSFLPISVNLSFLSSRNITFFNSPPWDLFFLYSIIGFYVYLWLVFYHFLHRIKVIYMLVLSLTYAINFLCIGALLIHLFKHLYCEIHLIEKSA